MLGGFMVPLVRFASAWQGPGSQGGGRHGGANYTGSGRHQGANCRGACGLVALDVPRRRGKGPPRRTGCLGGLVSRTTGAAVVWVNVVDMLFLFSLPSIPLFFATPLMECRPMAMPVVLSLVRMGRAPHPPRRTPKVLIGRLPTAHRAPASPGSILDAEAVSEALDMLRTLLPGQDPRATLRATPSFMSRVERGKRRLGDNPDPGDTYT